MIAPYILPHLRDRPLSLYLKLKGAYAPGVYIKDMEGHEPQCAEVFPVERKHKKEGKRDTIDYLVCNNIATLLYIVNLGAIDINPWSSRMQKFERPDYIIIDLDPSDKDFSKAIDAALATKEMFDKLKIKSFVKTSGKTGLHIYVPCSIFNFSQARILAEYFCGNIQSTLPTITTTAVSINERGDKLFLDPSQNDFSDTVAAPYSVRPNDHPTVSTPLVWSEVNEKLNPKEFTMESITERLKSKGDIFKPVIDEKVARHNDKVLNKILLKNGLR